MEEYYYKNENVILESSFDTNLNFIETREENIKEEIILNKRKK